MLGISLLALFLAGSVATAQESGSEDVFDASVGTSERYESNLFKLPDNTNPGGAGDRTSLVQSEFIGLKIDKTYSLQRILLDATVNHDRYLHYSDIDFTSRILASSYLWQLTPELSGAIIFNHSKVPNDFADLGYQTKPNFRDNQLKRLDVDFRPGAALHPRFSVFQVIDESDRLVFQAENSRRTSAEISLVYGFVSGNTLESYIRRAKGNNLDQPDSAVLFTDSEFTEREYGGRAKWKITGSSSLDGGIGYLDREYANFAVRSFKGVVGQLHYRYIPTGKLQLDVVAASSLNSSQTLFSSYFKDESFAIRPSWTPTGKITVIPAYTVERRQFAGEPFPVRAELAELTHGASMRVDWAALRSVDVSLTLARLSRNANDRNFQYVDRTVQLSARLDF